MRDEYDFSQGKRGAVVNSRGKTRITIYLDNDVLDAFKSEAEKAGRGYQTLINTALRQYLSGDNQPVDRKTLRRILREEFKKI